MHDLNPGLQNDTMKQIMPDKKGIRKRKFGILNSIPQKQIKSLEFFKIRKHIKNLLSVFLQFCGVITSWNATHINKYLNT